ncbi:MAG: hydrogenase maturation nickel metallochaperone HypA [Candidatus Lokiarchaeota archaeon]|nr:hydrogenase maturation nickel metallochaperone HypA [Candidatus Lokiarchaeota archaeon]
MHEFALVQNIIGRCLRVANQNNASIITDIELEVGDFSLVIEHMFQQSFRTLKKDTIAETAILHIKRTPGIIHCNSCNRESEIWWRSAVQISDSKYQQSLQKYEKSVTPQDVLTGNSDFGKNLFQCLYCESNDTELIKGKSIVIKNIKIKS